MIAWPAMVSVADLGVLDVFVVMASVALPWPDPPPVNVSHEGAPDAVQLHPPCVVTPTVDVIADARTVRAVVDTV